MAGDSIGYIAALDVGTTTVRCQIINQQGTYVGSAFGKVKLHYRDISSVEIDPEELWTDIIRVIKEAIKDANTNVRNIRSLGISTQRCTFITWRKDNGKPFHNFITWKDLRASDLIKEINKSWKIWALHMGTYLAYIFTRHLKFGMVSRLKFASNHVTIRLLWLLQNNREVQKALFEKNLMFGTMDTWLIYKLTGGKTYVSDISNASATGMYDPFSLCWSFIPKYINVPISLLPPVVDNDYEFGETLPDIFGVPIQIGAVMADQSASMYGSCSFKINDIKLTLGTGGFLDNNTGSSIHGSLNGMYPLVGWRIKNKLVYLSEVPCSDAGSLIEWMLAVGLIPTPNESTIIANNVKHNGGVYFIPAFSGLGPPINNETASSGFIGIKPNTGKEYMVRAVLESIVYRTAMAYGLIKKEDDKKFTCLRIDGGVSKNDFICQMLADLTNLTIKRMSSEMATVGVAYVAGLSCDLPCRATRTALQYTLSPLSSLLIGRPFSPVL